LTRGEGKITPSISYACSVLYILINYNIIGTIMYICNNLGYFDIDYLQIWKWSILALFFFNTNTLTYNTAYYHLYLFNLERRWATFRKFNKIGVMPLMKSGLPSHFIKTTMNKFCVEQGYGGICYFAINAIVIGK